MIWSFNFRENTDVLRLRDVGRISYLYGLSESYKPDFLTFGTLPNNKPPGETYVASGMFWINIQVSKLILKIAHAKEGSIQWINSQLLNAHLRLPSIIADIIITFLIYHLVRQLTNKRNALIASSLFLLNPVIIYNSSFWGQMDSINNLFFYFCIFFLLYNRNFSSIFSYFLSLFMKLSLVPFLPVIFLYYLYIYKNQLQKIIANVILATVLLFIATLPISHQPLKWSFEFFQKNSLGEMTNITAFAFNFWWIVFMPKISLGKESNLFEYSEIRLLGSPLDNTLFSGIPLFYWALVMFFLFFLPIIYTIIKLKDKSKKPENIFLTLILIALCMYIFLPRMHERYLYPIFPLLATYIGIKKKYLITFIVLSVFNFINLLITWHPMRVFIPYSIMNNVQFQWVTSLLTVATFFVFYIRSLKTLFHYE